MIFSNGFILLEKNLSITIVLLQRKFPLVYIVIVQFLYPVYTAPFMYKNADLKLSFCEIVHTTPRKNVQKRPSKWTSTKTEAKPQKQIFFPPLL